LAVLRAQISSLDVGAQTMFEFLSVMGAENVPVSVLKSLFDNQREYLKVIKQLADRAVV
jgi:hypothetical protein